MVEPTHYGARAVHPLSQRAGSSLQGPSVFYTPSQSPRKARAISRPMEPDLTPLWLDATLCLIGALMFLSNLLVLAQY
jgi:hypothetical protein